ncbi:hypothetical protein L3X38_016218 [Prunus dulcis]|uniref:Uncharacterized protein n=1 Tax=Prunus dulcis TaxID=3755 RepID=A0AAD4W6I0_PRUDU|nr:hypothetical protein L3X38_016218 [Prunus dulcis]
MDLVSINININIVKNDVDGLLKAQRSVDKGRRRADNNGRARLSKCAGLNGPSHHFNISVRCYKKCKQPNPWCGPIMICSINCTFYNINCVFGTVLDAKLVKRKAKNNYQSDI